MANFLQIMYFSPDDQQLKIEDNSKNEDSLKIEAERERERVYLRDTMHIKINNGEHTTLYALKFTAFYVIC